MFTAAAKRRWFQVARMSSKKDVLIVSAVRTPIGSYNGSLSAMPTSRLGGIAIKEALSRAGLNSRDKISSKLGNVASENMGNALARQASIIGGILGTNAWYPYHIPCIAGATAINWSFDNIRRSSSIYGSLYVAGGFESMSKSYSILNGYESIQQKNDIISDRFWDKYDDFELGNLVEDDLRKYNISRQDLDNFTINSHMKAVAALTGGKFKDEIVPVSVPNTEGPDTIISEDDHIKMPESEKIREARPLFKMNGNITSSNSCKFSDGAAVVLLATREKVKEFELKPIGRIIEYAFIPKGLSDFLITTWFAINKAIRRTSLNKSQIEYYEISETYAASAVANIKLLDIDPTRVNVNGGALSLGHPDGATGARMIVTLLNVLRKNKGKYGVASVTNMRGEATAIIVESFN